MTKSLERLAGLGLEWALAGAGHNAGRAAPLTEYAGRPLDFVQEVLGKRPWRWQRDVLETYRTEPRVLLPTGKNCGRTFVLAAIGLHFFLTGRDRILIVTANTEDQVKNQLFAEFAYLYAGARRRLPEPGPDLTHWRLGPKWIALGLSPRNPTSVHGYHAIATVNPEYADRPELWNEVSDEEFFKVTDRSADAAAVMVIADEMGGMDPARWPALEGLLTGPGSKFVGGGNPSYERAGVFYELTHPPEAVKPEDWPYAIRHCSTLDAPDGLVDRAWLETMRRQFAPDPERHPRYQVEVMGQWPTTGEHQVYSFDLIHGTRNLKPKRMGGRHLGVDVAELGPDWCHALLLENGRVNGVDRWGGKGDAVKPDTFGNAERIQDLAEAWGVPGDHIHIDVSGNRGVYDALWRLGLPVDGVDLGSKPKNDWRHVLGQPPILRTRRQELHWVLLRLLQEGLVAIPDDPQLGGLVNDLTQIQMKVKGLREGEWSIEPKDLFKKRTGRSPDASDSLILALSRSSLTRRFGGLKRREPGAKVVSRPRAV